MENKHQCHVCGQDISIRVAMAQSEFLEGSLNTKEKTPLYFKYIEDKICPECGQLFKR